MSTPTQKKKLKSGTLFGIELVDGVARLCCMNLLLHGIGETDVGPVPSSGAKNAGSGDPASNLPVVVKDALAGKHGEYDLVLANPPFGKKSSVTIVNEAGETSKESLIINRDDFWASTSNPQAQRPRRLRRVLFWEARIDTSPRPSPRSRGSG